MTVPVIYFNEQEAERTFRRHQALVQAEQADPSLALVPDFVRLRESAYERFVKAFGRGE